MIQTIDFAPLDGITKIVFRQVWSQFFGGVDRYFIPFFSPTPHHLMTPQDLREVDYIHNANLPSVPQVMTKNADDFLWACDVLKDMGYTEVNLNLGCPSGTVDSDFNGVSGISNGSSITDQIEAAYQNNCLKDASELLTPERAKVLFDQDSDWENMTPEEFAALLDLYNRYPIACLTVHPRVRKEKYRGPVHLDVFADALANSRNPVCYNGDLRTVGEVRSLEDRFPEVTHVMIGRGLVADPALARKLRGGKGTDRKELIDFLAALYQGYTDFYQGQVPTAAQRMREVWFYLIHLFDDAEKLNKQLRRFRTPAEYERIQAEILASCPIRSDVQGDLI